MYYQSQDIRASTLAISESLKYRKNCFLQTQPPKQNLERTNFLDQQNIQPLFYKDSKSLNGSLEPKRQSRRKAGSIVKITRNHRSTDNQLNTLSRQQLGDRSNYLNSQYGYNKNSDESVGAYKKLYQQNKVLNQALKSKLYESHQKAYNGNPLIGLSNYTSFDQQGQISRKATCQNENFFQSNEKGQQVFNSKYEKMLQEYDKKKSFIKDEIQAMKQKSSLQNFALYDRNLTSNHDQKRAPHNMNSHAKNSESLQSSQYEPQYQKRQIRYQQTDIKPNSSSNNKKASLSAAKAFTQSNGFRNFNPKHLIETQKQDEIDKKFKAYQDKLEKHKDFQKRNPSVNKKQGADSGLNDKSRMKLIVGSNLKAQTLSSVKFHPNEAMKIFIDLIGKQIQKDEEVRVLKHSLKNVAQTEIEKVMKEKFSTLELNIMEKFKLNTEEYDPFYELEKSQVSSVEQTIRKLLGAIDLADNFWKNLIKGRLDRQQLELIFDTLNYGKRQEIGINDLARELSFRLNKTVRSREIFQIYNRLTPLTKRNFLVNLAQQQIK